jgi:hypothetical protein
MLPTIPHDKCLHVVYGACIALAASLAAMAFGLLPFFAAIAGLTAGTVLGLAKEAYDAKNRDTNTPDAMDAAATVIGALLVVAPLFFVGV